MKIVQRLALAVMLTALFIACKKDKVDPPFTIEGVWEGKLGNGSATPSGFLKLAIKPGGTIERINSSGNTTATGTWQLTGSNFSAVYVFADDATEVEITGALDQATKKISGAWSNDGGGEGTFYINKLAK